MRAISGSRLQVFLRAFAYTKYPASIFFVPLPAPKLHLPLSLCLCPQQISILQSLEPDLDSASFVFLITQKLRLIDVLTLLITILIQDPMPALTILFSKLRCSYESLHPRPIQAAKIKSDKHDLRTENLLSSPVGECTHDHHARSPITQITCPNLGTHDTSSFRIPMRAGMHGITGAYLDISYAIHRRHIPAPAHTAS